MVRGRTALVRNPWNRTAFRVARASRKLSFNWTATGEHAQSTSPTTRQLIRLISAAEVPSSYRVQNAPMWAGQLTSRTLDAATKQTTVGAAAQRSVHCTIAEWLALERRIHHPSIYPWLLQHVIRPFNLAPLECTPKYYGDAAE